jgi:hypothetical protein
MSLLECNDGYCSPIFCPNCRHENGGRTAKVILGGEYDDIKNFDTGIVEGCDSCFPYRVIIENVGMERVIPEDKEIYEVAEYHNIPLCKITKVIDSEDKEHIINDTHCDIMELKKIFFLRQNGNEDCIEI